MPTELHENATIHLDTKSFLLKLYCESLNKYPTPAIYPTHNSAVQTGNSATGNPVTLCAGTYIGHVVMNKNHNNLGTIVVTPGARNTMVKQGIQPAAVLQQHIFDGWPNGFGPPPLEDGFYVSRIMSAQKMPLGELWVITEFDSQITTITLPDEA